VTFNVDLGPLFIEIVAGATWILHKHFTLSEQY